MGERDTNTHTQISCPLRYDTPNQQNLQEMIPGIDPLARRLRVNWEKYANKVEGQGIKLQRQKIQKVLELQLHSKPIQTRILGYNSRSSLERWGKPKGESGKSKIVHISSLGFPGNLGRAFIESTPKQEYSISDPLKLLRMGGSTAGTGGSTAS